MDAYSKTWLQFVFPVYIWVLVGLMILVSNSKGNEIIMQPESAICMQSLCELDRDIL